MDDENQETDLHSRFSTLRERIVEHVFIGEALRRLWQIGVTDAEVLRSEFDAGGYDIVMSRGKIVRHVQFKTSLLDGSTSYITASLKLMDKPSGCIIWIIVTPQLNVSSYLWFGARAGEPLSDIAAMKVAKHTKGNAEGQKTDRPNHRIIPRRRFEPVGTLDGVLEKLFGHLA